VEDLPRVGGFVALGLTRCTPAEVELSDVRVVEAVEGGFFTFGFGGMWEIARCG